LTSQDGTPVSLADFRGKVVAVTFIYTLCTDTCPVLTPMMSFVQDRLGPDFGTRIAFVSITSTLNATPAGAQGIFPGIRRRSRRLGLSTGAQKPFAR